MLRVGVIFFLLLGGCSNAVWVSPQVIGGLNSNTADQYPSYSADGRFLAFASDRGGTRSIYLYDQQQRRFVDLPNLNRRDFSQDQPSLSANGRYIAYVTTERGKTDVMVYDRDRSRSELITANVRGSVAHPTISSDGRRIAFSTTQFGQWHIAVIER